MAKKKHRKEKAANATPVKDSKPSKPEKAEIPDSPYHEKLSVGLHTVAAIAMGFISFTLAPMIGNWATVVAGFWLLIGLGFATKRLFGGRGLKWWMGNGFLVYLFVWFISWTVFFNMIAR